MLSEITQYLVGFWMVNLLRGKWQIITITCVCIRIRYVETHTHTHTHTLRSFSDAAANSLTETCSKACWWSLFITVKSVRRWRRGYSRGLGRMAATSWGTARVWQESCACVSGGCDTWSVKRYVCHCKVYTHGLSFLFLRVWMCLSELKRYWL